jgi:hypothetical protein
MARVLAVALTMSACGTFIAQCIALVFRTFVHVDALLALLGIFSIIPRHLPADIALTPVGLGFGLVIDALAIGAQQLCFLISAAWVHLSARLTGVVCTLPAGGAITFVSTVTFSLRAQSLRVAQAAAFGQAMLITLVDIDALFTTLAITVNELDTLVALVAGTRKRYGRGI